MNRGRAVRIRCSHLNPIGPWDIDIEFRPLVQGFSVWLYEDNALVTKPKWTKLRSERGKLDWRRVAQIIKEESELRVYGNFWLDVEVSGIPEWARQIVLCFFIVDEESAIDYHAVGELLMGFSDEEIATAIDQYGPLPLHLDGDSEQLSSEYNGLIQLAEVASAANVVGLSLSNLKVRAGVSSGASLATIAQGLGKLAGDVRQARVVELSKALISESDSSVRQNLWAKLRESVAPWEVNVRIDLIRQWLTETEKPTGGRIVGYGVSSAIPTLMWLFTPDETSTSQVELAFARAAAPVNAETLLRELSSNYPQEAEELVSAVLSIVRYDASYFERPNQFRGVNGAISRAVKRSGVKLGLEIQEAADNCGIRIDHLLRIPDLPFLN